MKIHQILDLVFFGIPLLLLFLVNIGLGWDLLRSVWRILRGRDAY